jgi:hypothetical protein
VVGVVSYGKGRAGDPQIEGITILNDEFVALLDQACALRPANCEPSGAPLPIDKVSRRRMVNVSVEAAGSGGGRGGAEGAAR